MDTLRRMRIFQPKTYLSVDFGKKEILAVSLRNKELSDGFPFPDLEKRRFEKVDNLEMEIRDFISNVRKRTRPMISGIEGRRALNVALQVMDQINENCRKYAHLFDEQGGEE